MTRLSTPETLTSCSFDMCMMAPCQGDLAFMVSTKKSPTTHKTPTLDEIVTVQNEAAASINELCAEAKALRLANPA